jgi:hypothetical protein
VGSLFICTGGEATAENALPVGSSEDELEDVIKGLACVGMVCFVWRGCLVCRVLHKVLC